MKNILLYIIPIVSVFACGETAEQKNEPVAEKKDTAMSIKEYVLSNLPSAKYIRLSNRFNKHLNNKETFSGFSVFDSLDNELLKYQITSTGSVDSVTTVYDSKGKVVSINSYSREPNSTFTDLVTQIPTYNSKGQTDTVKFYDIYKLAEGFNVSYYDKKGLKTKVVGRFLRNKDNLIVEFGYDEKNRKILQKEINEAGQFEFIAKYFYDDSDNMVKSESDMIIYKFSSSIRYYYENNKLIKEEDIYKNEVIATIIYKYETLK